VTINVGRDFFGTGQPLSTNVVGVADSVGEVIVNVFESEDVPDVTINIVSRKEPPTEINPPGGPEAEVPVGPDEPSEW
jgi:hypothetical protein